MFVYNMSCWATVKTIIQTSVASELCTFTANCDVWYDRLDAIYYGSIAVSVVQELHSCLFCVSCTLPTAPVGVLYCVTVIDGTVWLGWRIKIIRVHVWRNPYMIQRLLMDAIMLSVSQLNLSVNITFFQNTSNSFLHPRCPFSLFDGTCSSSQRRFDLFCCHSFYWLRINPYKYSCPGYHIAIFSVVISRQTSPCPSVCPSPCPSVCPNVF